MRRDEKSLSKRKSSQKSKSDKKINKQAIVVTVIFSVIFLSMIGYYVYFLVVKSPEVINNSHNNSLEAQAKKVIRGTIYSSDGKKLAYTDTKGTENDISDDERVYPLGKAFSHAVGITKRDNSGIEQIYNSDLVSSQLNPFQKIIKDFKKEKERGSDVTSTINSKLQNVCYDALGDCKGAVFAMDPETGEILAMTSKPSFDPNLSGKKIDKLDDTSLVNRATQSQLTPGSVFKIFTTLEFMRENKDYNKFSYDCKGYATFDGKRLSCFNGIVHYDQNLQNAFANSCNSAFSTIGVKLNRKKFSKTCKEELFNSELPLDMRYAKSVFKINKQTAEKWMADTSIGQGDTTVSPAHMCLVASAIYNNGILMNPYIVSSVENSEGTSVMSAKPKEYKHIMTEEESKVLKKYMRSVVTEGTANEMAYSPYKAYGKTGTAELEDDIIHSWFVGFAKKGKKKIAIAVVLERIHQGSNAADIVSKEILDSYFN